MKKGFIFLFALLLISFAQNVQAAEVVKIYPISDAVGQLYDDDNIFDWQEARNFQGEIFRTPFESGFLDNIGNIGVRSDNGVGTYRIYRVSAVFDTSKIPDNAQITKASLNLYKSIANNQGNIGIVVTSHTREDKDVYQKKDWKINNFGTIEFSRSQLVDNEFTKFNLNNAGINYLKNNKETATFGFLTNFDFDNIQPVGFILAAGWYEVEKEGTLLDPYLEIEYEIPSETTFPLYTQIVSPHPSEAETASWANLTFAGGTAGPHCKTIAACGCAITSTVMLARSYGITTGIDGSDVNPANFDRWLVAHNGYKGAGNLDFSQAIKYFGVEENGIQKSYFIWKDTPLNSDAVRQKVTGGVPVVSQMNAKFRRSSEERGTHFVLITKSLNDGQYGVNDPIWYNTNNLDDDVERAALVQDYNNQIVNGRDLTFSASPVVIARAFSASLMGQKNLLAAATFVQTSAFLSNAGQAESSTAPAEMFMITPSGNRLGRDPRNSQNYTLANGYYGNESFLVDPFEENALPSTDVLKSLSASELEVGNYMVYVIGTGAGSYKYSGLVHDASGHEHPFAFIGETTKNVVDVYAFNTESGTVTLLPVDSNSFSQIIDSEITDETLNKFFKMWADKILTEIELGQKEKAIQHIETFRTLLKAKKVESPAFKIVLNRLEDQLY